MEPESSRLCLVPEQGALDTMQYGKMPHKYKEKKCRFEGGKALEQTAQKGDEAFSGGIPNLPGCAPV